MRGFSGGLVGKYKKKSRNINMKKVILLIAFCILMILIFSSNEPDPKDLIEVIELNDKKYNIEIYLKETGATTSNIKFAYFHYHWGVFENFFQVNTDYQQFGIKRVNKNTIAIIVRTSKWPEKGMDRDTIYYELP
jgi:hypothetical protein